MALDLNKLRIFLEAARARNYTVAGRRLHLSQSAVSHAIRKLEESAGCTLIDWRGRHFHLTPSGTQLLGSCERIFRELGDVEQRLCAGDESVVHAVLGVTVEFGTTVLLPRLGPALRNHPELHVDFVFSNHLSQPLAQGELDLVVDCKPHPNPALLKVPLFREKYVVLATSEFLSRHPVREPLDLADVPILSLDSDATWWANLFEALPRARRPAPRRIVVATHVRGIVNAALAGMGVGLAPKYTVLKELAAGQLLDVFPDLNLLEDEFCIYQWQSRADRPENMRVTQLLRQLPFDEYGDALTPPIP